MKQNQNQHKLDRVQQDYKIKQHQEYQEGNQQENLKKAKKKLRMMINQKQDHPKLEDYPQIRIRNYNLEEADRALNQEEIKIFKEQVK